MKFVVKGHALFFFCIYLLVNNAIAQGGWRTPATFSVSTDRITDITDSTAVVHGTYSCINSYPYGEAKIQPSIVYSTHYYQGPGNSITGLPDNAPTIDGQFITLNNPTTASCSNQPFSIELTGLTPGTGYNVVTMLWFKSGQRTFVGGIKSFHTKHGGRHYTRADTLSWLTDSANNYFKVHSLPPQVSFSSPKALISSYYSTTANFSKYNYDWQSIVYSTSIIYKSSSPNILQECMASNYFDYHTKNVDYWEFNKFKNQKDSVLLDVNPNQTFYYTSSLKFRYSKRVSGNGFESTNITYRLFGNVDSINPGKDSLQFWLQDTATSYFDVRVKELDTNRTNQIKLQAQLFDNMVFPHAIDSMNEVEAQALYVFYSTSPNIRTNFQSPNYFEHHTIGINYWKFDLTIDPLSSFLVKIKNLNPNVTYYYTTAAQFEFSHTNDHYRRSMKNIRYLLVGNIDSVNIQPPISNNRILSPNQVICEVKDSASSLSSPLQGSTPTGGYGNYKYQWQSSYGDGNWINASMGAGATFPDTSKDFQPPAYWTNQVTKIYYRRIVNTLGYSDTSASVRLIRVPPKTLETISISVEHLNPQEITLKANIINSQGNEIFQWEKWDGSLLHGHWKPMQHDTLESIVIAPAQNKKIRVKSGYGMGCLSFESATVGFSPRDGDSNSYPVVQIGTQFWLMSNLKTTKFLSGVSITKSAGYNHWKTYSETGEALYSWYQNDSLSYSAKYGALYSWMASSTENKVCPLGWQIATESDWLTLSYFVGGEYNIDPAAYLKGESWPDKNAIRPNSYNFNAQPAGQIDANGNYHGIYYKTSWWGLVGYEQDKQFLYFPNSKFTIEDISSRLFPYVLQKTIPPPEVFGQGNSIRCIKK